MKENPLVELFNTSDFSVSLFVKDGKMTMVVDKELDTEFLSGLFAYVSAMLSVNDVDSNGESVVH
ncbi:MAG: hypothetical protein ACO22M_00535 [Candidatus Nanopelagicaceae bacterium]